MSNLCRLCGEERSPLDLIELNDQTSYALSYRELITKHTRVHLFDSKLLPQSICEDCKCYIEGFAEFSQKIQTAENFEAENLTENKEVPQYQAQCFVSEIKVYDEVLDEIKEELKEEGRNEAGLPVKKRSKKASRAEKHEATDIFDLDFLNCPSLDLNLDVRVVEELENGEVSEATLKPLNLDRWSSLLSPCEICQFGSLLNLLELNNHHNISHNNSKDIEISCSFCAKKFKKVFSFINHITSKHLVHLKHCCLICDKIFINLKFLNHHLASEHPTGSQQIFQCLVCGQIRDSLTALQSHCNLVHSNMNIGKRKGGENEALERPKRHKNENIKAKTSSDSEKDVEGTESEYQEVLEDEMATSRPRRRNSGRSNLYGVKIDSFEQLFADEIKGNSKFKMTLHLNISQTYQLYNGEIPEEHAVKFSPLWRDVLSCGICHINFSNINDLFEHADCQHSVKTKVFNCQHCDGEFTAHCESSLINHMVERHYQDHLKFCCLVCSKMFYDLLSLMNHYKSHDGKFKLLVCLICGWYAKNLDDLKEHKAIHFTSEKSENQLLCDKVFEKFNSGQEQSARNICVADYEKNTDGTVKEEYLEKFTIDWSFGEYLCACSISYTNPFDLFVHQRLKHPKEFLKKIYSCKICKKNCSNLFTFINHATSKHIDNAKFTCIVCTKVFWNFLALANHYKNVHPTFPCIFCCHCGKIFMNVTSCASHFKTLHLLRTPEERKLLKEGKIQEDFSHICHVCARSFKNRGTLLNHVKTHEALEPSDLLQCHICSKFYKNKYKLQQHMVCHEDLRSWKCKVCGQAFNYKKLLQRHIQAVHENERPFGCTFCEKRFNSKYDLTVHVRLHTGEFPYECTVEACDAKYPAWSNLFKHCQSRHKLDIRSEGYKKLKATQAQKNTEDYETDS